MPSADNCWLQLLNVPNEARTEALGKNMARLSPWSYKLSLGLVLSQSIISLSYVLQCARRVCDRIEECHLAIKAQTYGQTNCNFCAMYVCLGWKTGIQTCIALLYVLVPNTIYYIVLGTVFNNFFFHYMIYLMKKKIVTNFKRKTIKCASHITSFRRSRASGL